MKGPSEEIYTANQRKEHNVESTLVHSVGYNAVADNTIIRLAIVASESAKPSLILQKYDLKAVQGHTRSSILVSIESSSCNFLFVVNSNYGRIPTVLGILTHLVRK